MAPTPLSTKGGGTLARKWRKLKKRCSSFSSSDAIGGSGGVMARSRSSHLVQGEEEDAGFEDGERSRSDSVGGGGGIRGKLNQWNNEIRRRGRRRSSQVKFLLRVHIRMCKICIQCT